MKLMTVFVFASGLGALLPATASAQVDRQSAVRQGAQASNSQQAEVQLRLSREADKPVRELEAAVKANDVAAIPAKLAAAQAAARTPDDHYAIASLRLEAATKAQNEPEVLAAVEAMLATGKVPEARVAAMQMTLAKGYYALKQYDRAAQTFEQVLARDPRNVDATLHLADVRNAQGRPGDSVTLIRRAIAAVEAGGQKASPDWYRRALARGFNARLPVSIEVSRDWVRAYPTTDNWKEALRLYRNLAPKDDALLLDVLRLQRAVGALDDAQEYYNHAYLAIAERYPGESKAVLEEGLASGKISRSERRVQELYTEVSGGATDRARAYLAEGVKDALADPQARLALRSGDSHYGFGDYAKAAEMYRAALGKAGADANLINFRLGMALARAGDHAGATAAFNAVTGPYSDLAKFWLVHIQTKS